MVWELGTIAVEMKVIWGISGKEQLELQPQQVKHNENLRQTGIQGEKMPIRRCFDLGGQTQKLRIRGFPIAMAAAVSVALLGCQGEGQKMVSLEEAKNITTQFGSQSFTPPPRTVADILEILNEEKAGDLSKVEALRAEADRPNPSTTDPVDLWRLYRKRGLAAVLLGRYKQGLEDIENALAQVRKTGRNDIEADQPNPRGELRSLATANRDIGNFAKALHYSREEEKLTSKTEKTGRLISVYSNHAHFLANMGLLDEAESALDKAAPHVLDSFDWRSSQEWAPITRSQVPLSEGRILSLRGQYPAALEKFQEVENIIRRDMEEGADKETSQVTKGIRLSDARHSILLRAVSKQAGTLRFMGRIVEAEALARSAIRISLKHFGRYSHRTTDAVTELLEILARQGRYDDSRTLADEVLRTFDKMGAGKDTFIYGRIIRLKADSLVAEGKGAQALPLYDEIAGRFDSEFVDRLRKESMEWAVARLQGGQASRIIDTLNGILEDRTRIYGAGHVRTAEAAGLLAVALAGTSDDSGAAARFKAAVPILVGAPDNAVRSFILENYIAFLSRISGTTTESASGVNAADAAFGVADVLRWGNVSRALSANAARAAVQDPALADLVRRKQDAEHQIEAFYGLLNNALSGDPGAKVAAGLRTKIANLESARNALDREIRAGFPDYADLINPPPPTVAGVQTTLRDGEALVTYLVTYYVGSDRTFAWAVPKSGAPIFTSLDIGRNRLDTVVAELRTALDPGAVATLGDIPAFDVAAAHDLYAKLLQPLEAGWKGAKSLLIVANGALGQLPFSLLPTKPVSLKKDSDQLFDSYRSVPWLARTHGVTVLPSVASLKALRGTRVALKNRRPFVGFGDPFFNKRQQLAARKESANVQLASRGVAFRSAPQTRSIDSAEIERLPRLPDTRTEIEQIARVMKADSNRDIYLGERANEETVKSLDLTPYKVISFATHGLVPGDLNGLNQPALALSSPKVTGGKGDGLLTMGEILALKLNADWVVLSACNTASAEGAGAEAVSGLGRAFFYAGARSLLVSNWPVNSGATTELMTHLFSLQARNPGLSRAEALRETRLHMIEKGTGRLGSKAAFSYAHPIFWAPFTLVGDGGGARSGS